MTKLIMNYVIINKFNGILCKTLKLITMYYNGNLELIMYNNI